MVQAKVAIEGVGFRNQLGQQRQPEKNKNIWKGLTINPLKKQFLFEKRF